LSDEELLALANGDHNHFLGCQRKAIKHHARRAGAALLVLKDRLKHGTWEGWLEEHFAGSAEQARVYMKIAKCWPTIEELGLDRDGVTMEQLRWVLSDSDGPPPAVRRKQSKSERGRGPELKVGGADGVTQKPPEYEVTALDKEARTVVLRALGDTQATFAAVDWGDLGGDVSWDEEGRVPEVGDVYPFSPPPSTVRVVQLLLDEDGWRVFDDDVRFLMERYETSNVTDTVTRAVSESRRRAEGGAR
jgi:hypothetical protein